MISKLFRRLTVDPAAGTALFDWATRTARDPAWYVEGGIPDTIDGRFASLSTAVALCCVRLEELGPQGETLSVKLTERFADVMESEHRELGIGDPTLGKTVLKLVGALSRRVGIVRTATANGDWGTAASAALPNAAEEAMLAWRAKRLQDLWTALRSAGPGELQRGELE